MSDELQELWVRCRHLEGLNAELLEALEKIAAGRSILDHPPTIARAAIAKAKEGVFND
jgi:hypothetical protein